MSFYPSFYPDQFGQDSGALSFNGSFNESDEVVYGEYSSVGDEGNSLLTTNTASNSIGALASQPTSPGIASTQTSAAENFGFSSSDSSTSVGYFDSLIYDADESNETADWIGDLGDSGRGNVQLQIGPTFGTQEFGIGRQAPTVPDYDNDLNYAMTSIPFDFATPTPPNFFLPTNQGASSTDPMNGWTTSPMNEGSSSFPPTSASTATQTLDSDIVNNTQDEQSYTRPTHNASRTSNHNASRRASHQFACSVNGCNKSYRRIAELQRHQRTHTGMKDHGCRFGTCNRASPNGFARKDHLMQHLRQVHKISA